MIYSYDDNKNASNIKKHGLDFRDAYKVIQNFESITFEDNRFDYGERRYITIGLLDKVMVVLATSETEYEIRIISMRKATVKERDIYYANIR